MDDGRISPGELLWGRYKIEELLGEGGMGQVWAAFDKKLKRSVAIKIIRRKYADHPAYAARFQREAQAVAGLKHRNIVGVYDADTAPDGRLYMVMERVVGVTVRVLIETSKRIDLVTAVHIAIQVAAALGAAHAVNLWHRDIKPENIMVSTKGDVWVLDFGIAVQGRSQDEPALIKRGKRHGTGRLGTVGYTPPEEAMNQTADRRGDFYALGVVLYEMIAGQKPYPGVDEQNETEMLAAHAFSDPRPLMEIVPECPEWIWPIVARLLAKDPDERYDEEEELIADLRAGLRESVPPDHPFARKIDQDRHEKAREKAFAKRASMSSIPAEGAEPTRSPSSVLVGDPHARSPSPEPALGGWASTGPVAGEPSAGGPSAANVTKELSSGLVPSSPNTPRWLSPGRAPVEVTGPLPTDFVPSAPPSAPPFMQAMQAPPAVAAPAAQQATTELPEAPPEAKPASVEPWVPPFKLSPPAVPPPLSSLPSAVRGTPPSIPMGVQRADPAPRSMPPIPPGPSLPISGISGERGSDTTLPDKPPLSHQIGGISAASQAAPASAPAGTVEPQQVELDPVPATPPLRQPSRLLRTLEEMPTGRLVLRSLALGIALAAVVAVMFRPRSSALPAREDRTVVASASSSAAMPPTSSAPVSAASSEQSVSVELPPAAGVVSAATSEPAASMAARSTASPAPKAAKPPPGPAKSTPAVMVGRKPWFEMPEEKRKLGDKQPVEGKPVF